MTPAVTILGSTGSIGNQAVEVVRAHLDRFRLQALAAGGVQVELLAEEVLEVGAEQVAIADDGAEPAFRAALTEVGAAAGVRVPPVRVLTGAEVRRTSTELTLTDVLTADAWARQRAQVAVRNAT